jgi:epoxyqueuosine reductase
MPGDKNYAELKKTCHDFGADLFGVADIKKLKKDFRLSQGTLRRLDRGISLGVQLSAGILQEIESAPTRLYFHHYRTVNVFLDQMALKVTNLIQNKGFTALPVPSSLILDWQNQRAHLSHKKIAVSAGLGWIGRNNLLVNKDLGSRFRLVSILTDMPVKADRPLTGGDCRECRRCIKACPAGAIKEKFLEFEHAKCFEKLKEFQKKRLVDQYICGVCVNVCRGRRDA